MLQKHLGTIREKMLEAWGHRLFKIFGITAAALVAVLLFHAYMFGPPGVDATREDFVVSPEESLADTATALRASGFIKSELSFRLAYQMVRGERTLRAGGYSLARTMDAWTVAKTLAEVPRLSWITIAPGMRKEQIADLFEEDLGWTAKEKEQWNTVATEVGEGYSEGVYFPDTYLIPSDQPPEDVAARLRGRFEEAFAPYALEAAAKNIPWTDIVTLASLIEKEAGKKDKALVSGILWNRLNKGMLLQVDATLQYVKGSEANWWPSPRPADKSIDSPFNTYKYEGLPPEPIASPSLASIEAALNPEKTSCLYYLHDLYGRIHCSTNYKAHVANVNRYLR